MKIIAKQQKAKIKAFDSKPELSEHLYWYVNSFHILSSRRQYGMSMAQPITMVDILAYLTLYPWYDVETFIKYIIVLDNYFMKLKSEEYERRNNTNSNRPHKGKKGHR